MSYQNVCVIPGFRNPYHTIHKLDKSKFIARIHMDYSYLGIFVIPREYLIRKYFIDFSTPWLPFKHFNNSSLSPAIGLWNLKRKQKTLRKHLP